MFQKYENIFIEMIIFTHNNVCKSRSVVAERSVMLKKKYFCEEHVVIVLYCKFHL